MVFSCFRCTYSLYAANDLPFEASALGDMLAQHANQLNYTAILQALKVVRDNPSKEAI